MGRAVVGVDGWDDVTGALLAVTEAVGAPSLDLAVDPGWAIGLFLAQLRVAAFVMAAPSLAMAVPRPARLAFALAVGTALSSTVEVPAVPELVAHAVVNVGVGALLGWLVGIVFHTFASAGGIVDISASTSIAAVIDPSRGEQGALFNRLFQMVGLTAFHVSGGLTLLVSMLGWSTRAVPLDGRMDPDPGLADLAVRELGTMMVLAVELAAPVVAALFIVELVFGLAARFAPTANVFMLSLPVRVGLAMMLSLTCFAMFPAFTDAMLLHTRQTAIDVLNGIGVDQVPTG